MRVILLTFPQMTIAQLVYENERYYLTNEEIHEKVSMPGLSSSEWSHRADFPSADEDLASNGRMHSDRCVDHGADPSWSVEPSSTRTNALPASYARVSGPLPPSPSPLISGR